MSRYAESRITSTTYSHDRYASMKDPTMSKKEQRWDEIYRFIWNSEEKKFMGRTFLSWGKFFRELLNCVYNFIVYVVHDRF